MITTTTATTATVVVVVIVVVVTGQLVLAKYNDDKWYRGQLTRVLGHQVEVELIDFGSVFCVSAADGYLMSQSAALLFHLVGKLVFMFAMVEHIKLLNS